MVSDYNPATEQRKHARLDIALSVSYFVITPGGEISDLSESMSCDISAGGLRLMTPAPLQNGSVLNLEIRLPDQEEDPIRAKGEVVWQSKISDYSYETGTIIKNMGQDDKARFMSFVLDQMASLVGVARDPKASLN
ncbi:MAG: PilZ domain-containing protein [Deltaproteobacteria bacterium]|nr:PilZ domain-containing protein [Deltaproteobacteria bacterium]